MRRSTRQKCRWAISPRRIVNAMVGKSLSPLSNSSTRTRLTRRCSSGKSPIGRHDSREGHVFSKRHWFKTSRYSVMKVWRDGNPYETEFGLLRRSAIRSLTRHCRFRSRRRCSLGYNLHDLGSLAGASITHRRLLSRYSHSSRVEPSKALSRDGRALLVFNGRYLRLMPSRSMGHWFNSRIGERSHIGQGYDSLRDLSSPRALFPWRYSVRRWPTVINLPRVVHG